VAGDYVTIFEEMDTELEEYRFEYAFRMDED
jgi:hypothetical protein